jgi:hypothetical protein
MDRPDPPARVPVSAEWLAEQEAKQAAYVAQRRAWTAKLLHDPVSAEDEAPEPEPTPAPSLPPAKPRTMEGSPSGSRRGVVHDPRQSRFEF